MTIIELIEAFNSSAKTVSSFNNLFQSSPLRYAKEKTVRIENRIAENIYNIRVNGERIQHELKPCTTSIRSQIGKINSGSTLLSTKELKLPPTLLKVYLYLKHAHTKSFCGSISSKELNIAKHTYVRSLQKLQKLNIINRNKVSRLGSTIIINPESKWNL